ncbi:MAG: Stk1 family PASTA domain-containing Ser/Thr kinase [Oscillospiraceae bacterium]|jgi:serine/threonine-protein kinase|nr:Stk1 family PASTA domain-containing Ser/Thr kinase [Oscillospiraceae bacterium]
MDYYVGKILDGRYEIQEVLGIGGMAVVYRAYDNIDDRPVAVKILKEEYLANEEFRRRFKNESKAIAMLSHPNIVKVYDVSYGDRLQYIVMEYVEGITLKEYIEQRRVIPWKEAVHFLTQILRALQHAHDRGVVHRDIKPQNIMLLHSGNIKVTDFGIARFSRSETRTMSENAIGSVHYISPEQARGDFTDEKTDIYSVGVVLYEMLTGELPFQSDSTVSVAIMQLQSEPRRPREINDAIPLGLEQITIRAMQKNPADRYQSAAEMLLDLEEFKRNPLIRFEYSYFVDREPTKYVSPMDRQRAARPAAPAAVAPAHVAVAGGEEEEERSHVVPMMLGIIIGVIVLFGAIALVVIMLNKGDPTVQVDNFFGQQRAEIMENEEYKAKYEFEFVTEINDNYPLGSVFSQDPEKGAKRKPGEDGKVKVTLKVADAWLTVPDVRYKSEEEAVRLLEKNFTVEVKYEIRLDMEAQKVIRTDPTGGNKLETKGTVIVYVAVKEDPKLMKEVPDIIGWTVEQAKEALAPLGFTVNEKSIIEEASSKPKGQITWQGIEAGTQAYMGTSIQVHISSGIPQTQKASITVQVANNGGADATLRIYLDSEKKNEVVVLQSSGSYSFQVEGNGAGQKLLVTQDNETIYEATIDFTKTPPQVNEIQQKPPEPVTYTMPSVLGKTYEDAVIALVEAGFSADHITREDQDAPFLGLFTQSGVVAAQRPVPILAYPADVEIVLVVNR